MLGLWTGRVASIEGGLGRVRFGKENVLAREASDGKGDSDLDVGDADAGSEGDSSLDGGTTGSGGGWPSEVRQASRAACSSGLAKGSNSLSTSFAEYDDSKRDS